MSSDIGNGTMGAAHATPATKNLELGQGDVEIWQAALDEQEPDVIAFLQTLLSPDETERAGQFFFERERRRFIVGRGVLRMILGRYVGRAPEELAFVYGLNGKPALDGSSVRFNVAHSEGVALYAFTRAGDVGIDVEHIRPMPDWETVAELSFAPPELNRLRAVPEAERPLEFFRAWTRQEAVLKALGVGLSGAARQLAATREGFNVYPLEPAPGFVGALAIGPDGQWTRHHTWHAGERPEHFGQPQRSRRTRLQPSTPNGAGHL
jgi:4'-phosphopantetheinyl transferase